MEVQLIHETDAYRLNLVLEITDNMVTDVLDCEVIPLAKAQYRGKRSGKGLALSEEEQYVEIMLPYKTAERMPEKVDA